MDLYQLVYFKRVAELQSLTKASHELFMSQPALSKAITSLEDEVGVDLFKRRNRKMELSESGRKFYARAVRILSEIEGIKSDFREMPFGDANIKLFFMLEEYIPLLLPPYKQRNPDVHINHLYIQDESIQEALENGSVKLCVSPYPFQSPYFNWEPLFSDDMLLITPLSYPLEEGELFDLDNIAAAPLISTSVGTTYARCLMEYLKLKCIKPSIYTEIPNASMLPCLVSEGMGCAFVSELVYDNLLAPQIIGGSLHIKAFKLKACPLKRTIGLVWLHTSELNETELSFVGFLRDYCSAQFEK